MAKYKEVSWSYNSRQFNDRLLPDSTKPIPGNHVILTHFISKIMAQYQLVEKHAIEHHNEYYEVRTTQSEKDPESLFFITNEENLEDVAATIIADHLPGAKHWTVIPHRKDQ